MPIALVGKHARCVIKISMFPRKQKNGTAVLPPRLVKNVIFDFVPVRIALLR